MLEMGESLQIINYVSYYLLSKKIWSKIS
jgi:hypothetical protein